MKHDAGNMPLLGSSVKMCKADSWPYNLNDNPPVQIPPFCLSGSAAPPADPSPATWLSASNGKRDW